MAIIKYKDKNGEWKELAVLKGDSGVAPIINPDTNTWLVWDNEQGVYVDTGVVAGVGSEDFYASTYWVFNEMASGKKVIAKALTDRRYHTNNDESFVDMANKITNMSYEEGWFAKIGYTEENSFVKEMVDYSYELAKGWNPDGSTAQMFRGNTQLAFAPMVDTSNVTNMSSMFNTCSALSTIPQLDTSNVTNMLYMFNGCLALRYMLIKNIGKSSLTTYDFSGVSYWGTGGEENRQSLIDSLITYSYDRASNGMPTATITLSANTKALLTEEEIAQITNKGFTIT